MEIAERINRLMPCPCDIEISVQNSYRRAMISTYDPRTIAEIDRITSQIIELEGQLRQANDIVGEIQEQLDDAAVAEMKRKFDEALKIIREGLPEDMRTELDTTHPIDLIAARMAEVAC